MPASIVLRKPSLSAADFAAPFAVSVELVVALVWGWPHPTINAAARLIPSAKETPPGAPPLREKKRLDVLMKLPSLKWTKTVRAHGTPSEDPLRGGHDPPIREGMLLLDLVDRPAFAVELRQDVDATGIGFSLAHGPVRPASGPVGCRRLQSLVAKSALFLLVSPDATWPRCPGGFSRFTGRRLSSEGPAA